MQEQSAAWRELDAFFTSHEPVEILRHLDELTKASSIDFESLSRSSRTLSDMHRGNLKDSKNTLALGYRLLAAFCYLRLNRVGLSLALVEQLKDMNAPKDVITALQNVISEHCSRDSKRPQTPAPDNLGSRFPHLRSSFQIEKPMISIPNLQIPLLGSMSTEDVASFLKLAHGVKIHAGEILFQEGDRADAFFILAEGEMEVMKGNRTLKSFRDGDFFGEIGVLGNRPRTAALKATKESLLLAFQKIDLVELMAKAPRIERELNRFYEFRLFMQVALENPFFSDWPLDHLEEFFYLMKRQVVPEGTLLWNEGDQAEGLIFLVEGRVEVSQGGTPIAEASAGTFLGESAILKRGPRRGRVRALTSLRFLLCESFMLNDLSQRFPTLSAFLEDLFESRNGVKATDALTP